MLELVKSVMKTTDLVVAKPSETVLEAVKKMKEKNVGSVLVVDDSGRLVGIFTERDLVRLVAEGIGLDTPLEKVMTKSLIVANEGESIVSIAAKMIEHGIRHMPIVDNQGKLIGIVSIRDVLRHLVASCLFP